MKYFEDELTAHNGACPMAVTYNPSSGAKEPFTLEIDDEKTSLTVQEALALSNALTSFLDIHFKEERR